MSKTKDYILGELASKVTFANSRRMKHVASDVLSLIGSTDKEISLKTNLSVATVRRLRTLDPAKSGADYSPHATTLEAAFEAANVIIEVRKR